MPSPAPSSSVPTSATSSRPSSARGDWSSRYTARAKLVLRMKAQLNAQSWPRLQMMVIVALTGLAGLLASASFHKLGLHNMAVRYPLATLVAYGAFMGLLWLWLNSRGEDYGDVADSVDAGLDGVDVARSLLRSAGNDARVPLPQGSANALADDMASADGGINLGGVTDSLDVGDVGGDAEGLVVLLLVGLLVVVAAGLGLYVVVQAPALLAELALDGAVAGSLYHRLHQAERQHWAMSAWRYTRWVLAGLLVVSWLVGWGLHAAVPEATTLSQALSLSAAK